MARMNPFVPFYR